MRDTVKTEEYFREMYNEDAYYLDKWMSEYQETISHPEKYDIASYKYTAFTYASKKFYAGYSLELGMNEPLPKVDQILRNLTDHRITMITMKIWKLFCTLSCFLNRDLKTGWYRGYWCIAAAALLKALKLDNTELKDCKCYPSDKFGKSEFRAGLNILFYQFCEL